MGFENADIRVDKTAVAGPDNGALLDGVWNRDASAGTPSDSSTSTSTNDLQASISKTPTTESAAISNTLPSMIDSQDSNSKAGLPVATFSNTDGTPVSEADVSGMAYNGFTSNAGRIELAMGLPRITDFGSRRPEFTEVAARDTRRATAQDLIDVARDSVGSDQFGNQVPSDAKDFKNFRVPPNLKCASTSSEWLISIGMMTNREYKIRVEDMMTLLPQKGFTNTRLTGDFDLSKFPDGPIGFITGRGKYEDGSNHIGVIEKRNGELRVIHNNYRTGRVVDEDIREKFYTADGKPAYRDLQLFTFPRR